MASCCSIRECATHSNCDDLTRPCTIVLDNGFLQINSNSVTFETGATSSYLYEVTYPFTQDDLACLNDVDSDDPNAYVRVIKHKKRIQHKKNPTRICNIASSGHIPQTSTPLSIAFRNSIHRIVEEMREEMIEDN